MQSWCALTLGLVVAISVGCSSAGSGTAAPADAGPSDAGGEDGPRADAGAADARSPTFCDSIKPKERDLCIDFDNGAPLATDVGVGLATWAVSGDGMELVETQFVSSPRSLVSRGTPDTVIPGRLVARLLSLSGSTVEITMDVLPSKMERGTIAIFGDSQNDMRFEMVGATLDVIAPDALGRSIKAVPELSAKTLSTQAFTTIVLTLVSDASSTRATLKVGTVKYGPVEIGFRSGTTLDVQLGANVVQGGAKVTNEVLFDNIVVRSY